MFSTVPRTQLSSQYFLKKIFLSSPQDIFFIALEREGREEEKEREGGGRERGWTVSGREKEREIKRETSMRKKNIYWLPLIGSLNGDQTCNLEICSDLELNLQHFGSSFQNSVVRCFKQLSHTGQGSVFLEWVNAYVSAVSFCVTEGKARLLWIGKVIHQAINAVKNNELISKTLKIHLLIIMAILPGEILQVCNLVMLYLLGSF